MDNEEICCIYCVFLFVYNHLYFLLPYSYFIIISQIAADHQN